MTESNEKTDERTNVEYEIWISGEHAIAPILRGKNIDKLLEDARLMYPLGTFIIKTYQGN